MKVHDQKGISPGVNRLIIHGISDSVFPFAKCVLVDPRPVLIAFGDRSRISRLRCQSVVVGSLDDFTGRSIHSRCDDRASIDGRIFSGFTAVVTACTHGKGSDNQGSFLFILRNPDGVTPRQCTPKAEKNRYIISGIANCGPAFDVCMNVSENRNQHIDG
jgi:hypothetical protein